MSKPNISPEIQFHYGDAVITTLEQTVGRIAAFHKFADMEPLCWDEPPFGEDTSFPVAVGETIHAASNLLYEVGGLPLLYIDQQSLIETHTTGYFFTGYDRDADTWQLIATDHGSAPTPMLPYREVIMTTSELREYFAAAQDYALTAPIYPPVPYNFVHSVQCEHVYDGITG